MSWSGPIAGAAPHPSQPYANGQPGSGQQPKRQYGKQLGHGQYSQAQTYPTPGPPQRLPKVQPAKKKGNPIITRYPPPPGYRGPAQPYGVHQYPNHYQSSQPGFAQTGPPPRAYSKQGYTAPPTPQGYSPQGYGPPHQQNCPQTPYSQVQNPSWPPQPGYPSNQSYAQNHPGAPVYPPASSYSGYPAPPVPADPNSNAYAYGQASGWQLSSTQAAQYPSVHQYHAYNGAPQAATSGYDPNVTPTPISAQIATAQPPLNATENSRQGEKPQLFLAWDDWDFEFEGAIWPKSNEPVDPSLSLGVIIWHPAKQVTRALPSTFDEAEEQALKPAPEKLDNGESVSVYFMAENSHEAFLDVRQTDEWEKIKDDPIFVVFTDEDMQKNLVSLEDCIAQRDRPDEDTSSIQRDNDEEMTDASWSVMDHLEQVLSTTKGASLRSRDSQEDILAKLGVTGAPKPPTDDHQQPPPPEAQESRVSIAEKHEAAPLPLGLPAPPPRSQSFSGPRHDENRRAISRPYGSVSAANGYRQPVPPPPPPPPAPQRYGSCSQSHNDRGYDGSRGSPAPSEGSNHTMAGSDFESDKPAGNIKEESSDLNAITKSDNFFSRKRSYEDADHSDEKPHQQDDHTKRKRRSQIESAYSRR